MLGQRIVEPFPALEDVWSPHYPPELPPESLPEPLSGLTIRRTKSAGLRVVTESDVLWPDNTQVPANVFNQSTRRQSYLSVRTPDTNHTFGRPNPTMMSPRCPRSSVSISPSSTSPSTAILRARRLSRYSQAESALRSAVEVSSAEISSQELQIRALERATTMLSEQARDAQACATKLRACLAERGGQSLSPEEFQSLQRECWLEERRSAARQGQSAHTRDLLTKLCSPIKETSPPLTGSPAVMTREEANLARFMQLSPTHITFPTHRIHSSTGATVLTRRKTMSQIRLMRLRPSALELALRSPIKTRARSKLLNGNQSRRNSDSTDVTFVSEDASEQTTVVLPPLPLQLKLPPSPSLPGPNGVIRIEKMAGLRPRDTIVADVGDVPLPDYAVDLLEDLVASSLDIKFPEITRSPSIPAPLPSIQPLVFGPQPRTSSSVPDLTDFTFVEPPSPSSFISPSLSSPPPRPASRILGRLRSQSPDMSAGSFVSTRTASVRRRPATANAHSRASSTQSFHAPSLKFSSFSRLPSHPLFPVSETGSDVDIILESRPQSSMSGYAFESPETILERGSEADVAEGMGANVRRRFSLVSNRLRRFNSQGGGSGATGRVAGRVADAMSSNASLKALAGDADERGIISRFKRRISVFGPK